MRLPSTRELFALLGAAALSACSFVYDLSPDQCGNNADCESFGEGYSCIEGICKAGTLAQCTQASECPDSANVPTACVEKERGNPGSRRCEELRTAQCPIILPTGGGEGQELWREALASSDPIIVGGFAEVEADGVSTYSAAYDLAFSELQEKKGGIPGANGGLRPVIAVICNNGLDADGLSTGMAHLVEDLVVPGVVSAVRSDQMPRLFSNVRASEANPNVMFMSPAESDANIESIQDDDLIWTLLPNAAEVATAYKPLLTRAIDYLVAQGRVPEDEVIRVSLVYARDLPLLDELTDAVQEILVFNGMTFAENEAAGNAQRVNVISSYENPNADLSAQIDEIMGFVPHVIISIGADELFSDIIPGLEDERWVNEAPAGQRRPYYLLSPYHFQSPTLDLTFLTKYRTGAIIDPIELRMAGVQYASAPEAYQPILTAYEERFFERFPDDARKGYENFYDAPWWLLYSLVAGEAGVNSRFDGRDLVDGMSRLQRGTEYAMGPDDVIEAFNRLFGDANSTIQLNGTLGPPSFDNTGTRQSPGSVWCVKADATQVLDVLRVDESSGEPVLVDSGLGFDQCNPNF